LIYEKTRSSPGMIKEVPSKFREEVKDDKLSAHRR
jgi:hypothetical protein